MSRLIGGSNGDSNMGQILLQQWADRLSRQLLEGAEAGDVGLVHTALAQKADPNSSVPGSAASALHVACAGGSPEVVRLLQAARASVGARDAEGRSPLDAAIAAGSSEAAAELLHLQLPEVLNTLDATDARWDGAVLALLRVCPQAPLGAYDENVLSSFEDRRLNDTAELLFQLHRRTGAMNQDRKRNFARSHLFHCVARNWVGGLTALLRSGVVDANRLDPRSRRSALDLARALFEARLAPDIPEICAVLRGHGASEISNPFFEEWAVHLAAARGDVQGLSYWLRRTRSIDWREPPPPNELAGGLRCTALMMAAMEGHIDCVRELVKSRASLALLDAHGRSATRLALERGQHKVAKYLEACDPAPSPQARARQASELLPGIWKAEGGWKEAADDLLVRPPALASSSRDTGKDSRQAGAVEAQIFSGSKGIVFPPSVITTEVELPGRSDVAVESLWRERQVPASRFGITSTDRGKSGVGPLATTPNSQPSITASQLDDSLSDAKREASNRVGPPVSPLSKSSADGQPPMRSPLRTTTTKVPATRGGLEHSGRPVATLALASSDTGRRVSGVDVDAGVDDFETERGEQADLVELESVERTRRYQHLIVEVKRAFGLVSDGGLFSRINPFCRLTLWRPDPEGGEGHPVEVFETSESTGTEPEWNEAADFELRASGMYIVVLIDDGFGNFLGKSKVGLERHMLALMSGDIISFQRRLDVQVGGARSGFVVFEMFFKTSARLQRQIMPRPRPERARLLFADDDDETKGDMHGHVLVDAPKGDKSGPPAQAAEFLS